MHPRRSLHPRAWSSAAPLLAFLATVGLTAGCGDNINPDNTGDGTESDAGGLPDAGITEPDAAPVTVITCEEAVPAATEGTCDVTAGTGSAVLLRGTVLGAETVYENGAVLYDGNAVACVGCDCGAAPGAADATRVDCASGVISPGLINPHDHITYTEGAPIDHGETRYNHRHAWRGSLPTPQNPHGTGGDGAGTRWGEVRMMLSGVTSIIGSGGANGLVRNLDRAADASALGLADAVEFETFPLGDANETFRSNCGWSYSIDEREAAALPAFLPHVAEGIDAYAADEFRCQSTSFGGGQDFTESNDAHIHSIGLDAAGYARMAREGTRLIWSPRSNISLYGLTAMVSTFARLGGVVALGTDWTYSGSVNMVRELACADEYNRDHLDGYFSDRDLWLMATENAALATRTDAAVGSLAEGKLADIAIYAGQPGQHHRAVLEATAASTVLVLINGQPVFGEPDVVAGLGQECEALDVCEQARSICLGDFSTTYEALLAEVSAGEAAYPAIFCGVPDAEPTCVPSRPGQFTGVAGDDDPDGDGLTGSDDNCPTTFNPIRPLDGEAQADVDGDGEGDACDPTPAGNDLDSDGVDNATDNCPFDENDDQADADRDGKGDACDFCPDESNPTSVCGEQPAVDTTIGAIQGGDVAEGTAVTVRGAVVTAVRGRDLFIQDPEGGTTNAGVHVFLAANAAGIAIGDVVDTSGTVTEYFEDTELDGGSVTRISGGGVIEPVELTAVEATGEAYEGMLVTITDITDVVNPYDCGQDDDGCPDENLWEVNGEVVVFDRVYQGTDWVARAGGSPVTGVMGFRFERRRIMPRTGADIGPLKVRPARRAAARASGEARRGKRGARLATKKSAAPR